MRCRLWWEAKGRWKRRQMVRTEGSASRSIAIGANGELKHRHWCQWRHLSVAIGVDRQQRCLSNAIGANNATLANGDT